VGSSEVYSVGCSLGISSVVEFYDYSSTTDSSSVDKSSETTSVSTVVVFVCS
jgi:hypothetical protein